MRPVGTPRRPLWAARRIFSHFALRGPLERARVGQTVGRHLHPVLQSATKPRRMLKACLGRGCRERGELAAAPGWGGGFGADAVVCGLFPQLPSDGRGTPRAHLVPPMDPTPSHSSTQAARVNTRRQLQTPYCSYLRLGTTAKTCNPGRASIGRRACNVGRTAGTPRARPRCAPGGRGRNRGAATAEQ